jgi:hypothetical protein
MAISAPPAEAGGESDGKPDEQAVDSPRIQLTRLERRTAFVPIRGITPCIPHAWSEKAIAQMREAQSGSRARPKHDAKVAEDEAEGATYYLPDGRPGLPATGFKAAIVGACRLFSGITMTEAKQAFYVEGYGPDQLVPFDDGYERYIREDLPRNANGNPDLRYRYAYWPWAAVLPVRFLVSQIDLQSVLTLVDAAGMGGVGDWRPSAPKSQTGTYGQFELDPDRDAEVR